MEILKPGTPRGAVAWRGGWETLVWCTLACWARSLWAFVFGLLCWSTFDEGVLVAFGKVHGAV